MYESERGDEDRKRHHRSHGERKPKRKKDGTDVEHVPTESEIIEIHDSSSEEEPSGTKKKHRHGRKHKRHRHPSPEEHSSYHHSDDRRRHDEEPRRSESKTHHRKHKREDCDESSRHNDDRVLLENVRIKEEKDYDRTKTKKRSREDDNVRERVKTERNNSSTRVKQERERSHGRVKEERHRSPDERTHSRRADDSRADHRGSRQDDRQDSRDNRSGRGRNRRPNNEEDVDEGQMRWGASSGDPANPAEGASTEKQQPDFKLSGKLTEDRNTYNGVVIKYSEPPEARMPKKRWRLYQFKGDESLPTLYIHRQSAYLIGRDRKVADLPIDHPSCSKQHAAFQYRLVTYQRANGTTGKQIRLYLIDLESANGTFINDKRIDPKKYVECMEKDVIRFGFSSREYVLLHDLSNDSDLSD